MTSQLCFGILMMVMERTVNHVSPEFPILVHLFNVMTVKATACIPPHLHTHQTVQTNALCPLVLHLLFGV